MGAYIRQAVRRTSINHYHFLQQLKFLNVGCGVRLNPSSRLRHQTPTSLSRLELDHRIHKRESNPPHLKTLAWDAQLFATLQAEKG